MPICLEINANIIVLRGVVEVLDTCGDTFDWKPLLCSEYIWHVPDFNRHTSDKYLVEPPFAYAVWTMPTWILPSNPADLVSSTMKAATSAAILSPSSMWNWLWSSK